MPSNIIFRNSWANYLIKVVLIGSLAINSGCITTLGYVPEDLKPEDKSNYIPTYAEVKKWASDVVDGYDSRATMNQQSLFAGALVAAAGAAALTGLAVFNAGSSWIKGIPIGTAFFGSVLAIYSNEQKAQIYRLGSEYIKELITMSDGRLVQRRLAAQATATALNNATQARNMTQQRLQVSEQALATQRQQADAAHKAADAATQDPQKDALTKSAQALDREVEKAMAVVTEAQVAVRAAEERLTNATRLDNTWNELVTAKAELAQIKATIPPDPSAISRAESRANAAQGAWEELTRHKEKEALCLRKDVNDMMRKVAEHIALLDPKNLHEKLKDIRNSGTVSPQVPPDNLNDLRPPVKSLCDAAI